jgi:hypothetical protein
MKHNAKKTFLGTLLTIILTMGMLPCANVGQYRMVQAQGAGTREELVEIAVAEIGYHEKASEQDLDDPTANSGDANYTKYARDVGVTNGYAWGAVFVWWCMEQAGVPESSYPKDVCATTDFFREKGLYRDRGTYTPKVGDYVVLGNVANCGIVESVTDEVVTVIAGNRGDSNAVTRSELSLEDSIIKGYGIILFPDDLEEETTEETTETATDLSTEDNKTEQSTQVPTEDDKTEQSTQVSTEDNKTEQSTQVPTEDKTQVSTQGTTTEQAAVISTEKVSSEKTSSVSKIQDSNCCYEIVSKKKKTVKVTGIQNKKITNLKIPAKIKYKGKSYKVVAVADNAFKNNSKIKTVSIGNNVKTIGDNAFANCIKLKKVTIGKNVTTIGKKSFYKCRKLNQIKINSSKLKKVGKNAFQKISKQPVVWAPEKKIATYQNLLKGK